MMSGNGGEMEPGNKKAKIASEVSGNGSGNVIDRLLDRDLIFIVRDIFLNLNSFDLRNAKNVCRRWNHFCHKHISTSAKGQRRLEVKLRANWRSPEERSSSLSVRKMQFMAKEEIFDWKIDGHEAFMGTVLGSVLCYDLKTQTRRFSERYHKEMSIQLSVSDALVVTVGEDGKMCMIDRKDGRLLQVKYRVHFYPLLRRLVWANDNFLLNSVFIQCSPDLTNSVLTNQPGLTNRFLTSNIFFTS